MRNKLNLGAGPDVREGWDNQYYKRFRGVNLVFNLENKRWPIKDNTYDFILCNHVIEHIGDLYRLFNELHRISRPDAIIKLEVPHYSVNFAFTQIDHKHYFGLDSLSILQSEDFQNKTKPFKIVSQRILFRGEKSSKIMRVVSAPINFVINLNHVVQLLTDRYLSKIIPFYSMEYKIRAIK